MRSYRNWSELVVVRETPESLVEYSCLKMRYINMSDEEKQSIEQILEELESKGDDEEVERDDTKTLRPDCENETESKYKVVDYAISQEPENMKETQSKSKTKLTEEVDMEIEVDPKHFALEYKEEIVEKRIHARKVYSKLTEKKYRGYSDWKPYRSESESG